MQLDLTDDFTLKEVFSDVISGVKCKGERVTLIVAERGLVVESQATSQFLGEVKLERCIYFFDVAEAEVVFQNWTVAANLRPEQAQEEVPVDVLRKNTWAFKFPSRREGREMLRVLQMRGVVRCEYEADFDLVDRLGAGAFGEVYLIQMQGGARRAMKMTKGALDQPDGQRLWRNFQKEVSILSACRHPGILRILDASVVRAKDAGVSRIALAMHFEVFPMSLKELRKSRGIKEPRALEIMTELLDALAYLHGESIAHRDVKMSNIMLRKSGRVCLIDFGLAERDYYAREVGTLGYMAPELLDKATPLGSFDAFRADVFSAGIVLYNLFAKSQAFSVRGQDRASFQQANANGVLDFDRPGVRRLGSACISAIKAMCSPLQTRPTAAQALKLPWFFSDESASGTDLETEEECTQPYLGPAFNAGESDLYAV
jgi:serine/threonine protein kinase